MYPTDDTQTSSAHHFWIDCARGIGIVLVVFGHVLGGLYNSGLFPHETLAHWIIYTLYTFHMPMFFFLAGMNASHSLKRGAQSFLAGKITTIVYPYVLWSLIQGSIIMLMARDANNPVTATDLAAIWYRPIGQFWFLYALMICHIVAALVDRQAVMVGLAISGLLIFSSLQDPQDLALTLHHFCFYVIGYYIPRLVLTSEVEQRRGWLTLAGIVVAFVIAAAASGRLFGPSYNSLGALPASLFGIMAVILLSKLLDSRRYRWLSAIGQMSMTIYILHILAGSGIRIIMLKLHLPRWSWLYLLVGTIAGVLLPMLAHVMLRRLGLLAAFGLAPLSGRKTQRDTAPLAASGVLK